TRSDRSRRPRASGAGRRGPPEEGRSRKVRPDRVRRADARLGERGARPPRAAGLGPRPDAPSAARGGSARRGLFARRLRPAAAAGRAEACGPRARDGRDRRAGGLGLGPAATAPAAGPGGRTADGAALLGPPARAGPYPPRRHLGRDAPEAGAGGVL